jgi:hypothetical protein
VDALDAAVGDDARPVERRAEVGGELTRDAEEVGLVLQGVGDLGVLQERLGGMQPTLRQTPPQYFSSMIATD